MAGVFSGKPRWRMQSARVRLRGFHAKIGQLVVERDFLSKTSGR
jgi:hypothetical protein